MKTKTSIFSLKNLLNFIEMPPYQELQQFGQI